MKIMNIIITLNTTPIFTRSSPIEFMPQLKNILMLKNKQIILEIGINSLEKRWNDCIAIKVDLVQKYKSFNRLVLGLNI